MAIRYWPFSRAAASSDSSRAFCSCPITIFVSIRLMMLRAEFPRVMGTPITRICRMMPPLLSGMSRDSDWFRCVAR